jgi:Zn-dependent protease with chaperone function
VAWLMLLGALVTFVVLVVVLTPWHPLPGAHITPARLSAYFTPTQIARSDAFFSDARWPSWLGLLLGLAAAGAVGFTRLGRLLVDEVRQHVRRWWLQVAALVLAVLLISRLATLPTAVWGQQVSRSYGLSTQTWPSWALDELKSLGVSFVVTSLGLLLLVGLARRFSRTWFLPAAAGAGALVVLSSFAYPVVIEPVFNKFTPLPDGPLRTSILALAHRDGVAVSDVLVADASRRTTALNAYVSGFGSTKRIVLYDTLLRSTPDKQIELIIAHELGHATRDDVLVGTLEGAVAAVMAMAGLFIVLRPERLRRPTGAGSMRDPAIVPAVLALAAFASVLALPVQNTISRHIEARADAHSLDLTSDPTDFIKMQRRLAVTNLNHLDPNPILSDIFNSHPPPLDRIGLALAWERQHKAR